MEAAVADARLATGQGSVTCVLSPGGGGGRRLDGWGGCRGPGQGDRILEAEAVAAAGTERQRDIFTTRQNATVCEAVPRAASQGCFALLPQPLIVAQKKV